MERWCARLAVGQMRDLPAEIVEHSADDVGRYLQVGWGERRRLLTQELALVALAFDDFPTLVDRYLCTVAKTAQAAQSTDQQRFLRWLTRTRRLTPQQRDFIAYQQAEYRCLGQVRARRAAHVAFQRLRRRIPEVGADVSVWHLNPVRTWLRWHMPGDDTSLGPCDLVFFPVGDRVENVRVSRQERRWLRALPGGWAGTFESLLAKTGCRQPEQLRTSLESWTTTGLVVLEKVAMKKVAAEPSKKIEREFVTTRNDLR
ncbi:MAG TPA: hypothetical protein VHC22_32900 [Pirellulales bacterium]|nr:hypothetical protein [Pirellulales bacterium]